MTTTHSATRGTQIDLEAVRADFEATYVAKYPTVARISPRKFDRNADGEYIDGTVFVAWDMWQVALARAGQQAGAAASEPQKEKMAPVQGYHSGIPWAIHLEAYEVYCKLYGKQPALIDLEGRNCRGGFSTGELDQWIPGWRDRVSEFGKMKAEIADLRAQLASAQQTLATSERLRVVDAQDAMARFVSAQKDTERLDWMAHHGMALRIDPAGDRWFLVAPYHTGVSCVDDHQRFATPREAIDAARAQLTNTIDSMLAAAPSPDSKEA